MRTPCLLWMTFVALIGISGSLKESSLPAEESPVNAVDVCRHPLTDEERSALKRRWDDGIAELSKKLETQPDDVTLLSKRGDLLFFRGDFAKSVRDYERMCEVDRKLEASHWRLGIAYFYADQAEKSATLFDQFFQIDNVDRECGLWKFVGDAKVLGEEKARERLLKYSTQDREPLPTIYRLFEGQSTPDDLLKSTRAADVSESVREQRLFYIELYIGLWHDAQKRPKDALPHLRAATVNKWPRSAGYGPNYMWHVARLHFERLAEESANVTAPFDKR